MSSYWLITHPDVEIDPAVDVCAWRLSARGRARMAAFVPPRFDAVWSSTERKAMEAAEILTQGGPFATLDALGENDRSSTGYLPRAAFEAMADIFFAAPEASIRGWERAIDAQARIVAAVGQVMVESAGTVAIVAHGAVGALLLCHVTGVSISRAADQPPGSGGHFFVVTDGVLQHGWRAIDR